jgi:chromosomal replication initiation ATPase DnaA
VIHACKKIETDLETDPVLRKDVETLDKVIIPLSK